VADHCQALADTFSAFAFAKAKVSTPLVSSEYCPSFHPPAAYLTRYDGVPVPNLGGRAEAIIDCSPMEALAYVARLQWRPRNFANPLPPSHHALLCSRERSGRNRKQKQPAFFIPPHDNPLDTSMVVVYNNPMPLYSREYVTETICYSVDGGDGTQTLMLAFKTLPGSLKIDYGTSMKVVRASAEGLMSFTAEAGGGCRVVLKQWGSFGGWIGNVGQAKKAAAALEAVARLRSYFQRDEELDQMSLQRVIRAVR
jgi:hypothetical protein